MKNRKLIAVKVLATIFLFIGIVGWFVPFLGRPFGPHTELPNSEPHGICIDKEGNIYCGSAFYGRIQKYSPVGRFLRGFDTYGGTGMGTDFGFYFDEDDHFCVLVSGLSHSQRDSFYRLTVYDSSGNVLKTEKYTKPGTDYFYPVKSQVVDLEGNIYVFKGFLFPRVVKITQNGAKSIIIRNPLWIWFFQGPFPAGAFFFVSLFAIIFFADKAALLEATINYLSDTKKSRKFAISALAVLGLIISLMFLVFIGIKKSPMIVIFGFISFAIMFVLVFLVSLLYILKRAWYYRKHYPEFSGKWTSHSMREHLEFGRVVRATTANDPLLIKMETKMNKFVKLCLLVWLLLFLVVSIIGVINDLI